MSCLFSPDSLAFLSALSRWRASVAVSLLALVAAATPALATEAPVTRLMIKLHHAAPSIPFAAPTAAEQTAEDNLAILSVARAHGVVLRPQRRVRNGAQLLALPHAMSANEARLFAKKLKLSARVSYAEPDYLRHASSGTALTAPNDSRYNEQWALLAPSSHFDDNGTSTVSVGGANALPAWSISTGITSQVIAIIDTGILPHTDFNDGAGNSRVLAGYDFISDPFISNKGGLGRGAGATDTGDWVSAGDAAQPQCAGQSTSNSSWHGTHVAGVAAATGNNNAGVAGVNWGVRILPVRVLGKCGGYDSDIIDAIYWAAGFTVSGAPVNSHPAEVINLSLGSAGTCTAAYQAAFDELHNSGTVMVAAAGNEAAHSVNTPANCNHVIAVSAHSLGGLSSFYANTGSKVAISAPGGGQGTNPSGYAAGTSASILSLSNSGLTHAVAESYASQAGTSQATAYVSATAALIRGILPTVTPARLERFITSSARAFPAGSWCTLTAARCGAGLLDIGAALQAANFAALNNRAPSAPIPPNQEGMAGKLLSFVLPSSDPDGDSLNFQTVIGLPRGATLSRTGAFQWSRPVAGSYTLLYQIDDGIAYSATQQVRITITPAPAAPAASGGGGGGSASPWLLALLALAAFCANRHRSRRTKTSTTVIFFS